MHLQRWHLSLQITGTMLREVMICLHTSAAVSLAIVSRFQSPMADWPLEHGRASGYASSEPTNTRDPL